MKHYGDICKIDGSCIEPVDCITFGSPCQDLSIAGKRAGLSGERSGLFSEAVRIIREMRHKTNGKYPTFVVWENVLGAFSSRKGEDFRSVLEELARVKQTDIVIPRFHKKWNKAGAIVGDGWSIAWRTFDAKYWGVPQRRRRIALVMDFAGQRAAKILFEQTGVRGDSEESGAEGKSAASGVVGSIATGDGGMTVYGCYDMSHTTDVVRECGETAPTLQARMGTGGNQVPLVAYGCEDAYAVDCRSLRTTEFAGTLQAKSSGGYSLNFINPVLIKRNTTKSAVCAGFNGKASPGAGNIGFAEDVAPTLRAGASVVPNVVLAYGIDRAAYNQGINALYDFSVEPELAQTLVAKGPGAVTQAVGDEPYEWVVRRLTPTECERLQGYPDGWTDIGAWADSKGKSHKESSDSARYKALGNSIALPQWQWLMGRMAQYLPPKATLGSLFDGIGGFPLVWERIHGAGTAVWASEIEDFPMAVTQRRFCESEKVNQPA